MLDLKELLIDKFKQNRLAHFYILRPGNGVANPSSFLENWIHDYLTEVIKFAKDFDSIERANRLLNSGHADITFIKKDKDRKEYSADDFSEFLRFQSYSSFELPAKFVIIADAHLISKAVCNKLLKTLEEPINGTTIFFLHPSKSSFIPTIQSRAISLTVTPPKKDIAIDKNLYRGESIKEFFLQHIENYFPGGKGCKIIDYLDKKMAIYELIDWLKSDRSRCEGFVKLILLWEQHAISDYKTKDTLIEELKWFQKADQFHNQFNERLFALIHRSIDKSYPLQTE